MRAWLHAAPVSFVSGSSLYYSCKYSVSSSPSSMASSSPRVKIAIVGDVHGFWNLEEDSKALQLLQPDLVLFTGDFGEENVELVQSVSRLQFAKAVILGNHDAWYSQEFGKRKNGVQMQLEALADEHVGYQRLDFPTLKLSVVGGRPFSHGGGQLFRKRLLVQRYGVQDMDASAARICKAALGTPEDHWIIVLAHNGPTGLGSEWNDICGRDWVAEAGDHGDPDLAQALCRFKETAKFSIPLVIFGHMHKELQYGDGHRKMIVVGEDKTIYLNGAIVPRVERLNDERETASRSFKHNETSLSTTESGSTARAFTLVEIADRKVDRIAETWVEVAGDKTRILEEHVLFHNG